MIYQYCIIHDYGQYNTARKVRFLILMFRPDPDPIKFWKSDPYLTKTPGSRYLKNAQFQPFFFNKYWERTEFRWLAIFLIWIQPKHQTGPGSGSLMYCISKKSWTDSKVYPYMAGEEGTNLEIVTIIAERILQRLSNLRHWLKYSLSECVLVSCILFIMYRRFWKRAEAVMKKTEWKWREKERDIFRDTKVNFNTLDKMHSFWRKKREKILFIGNKDIRKKDRIRVKRRETVRKGGQGNFSRVKIYCDKLY